MSALARRRTRDTNTWPGFVDALASLLMVIIFVLMIFIVAQFYLTQILSGKDETLARLAQQVSELTDLLALEREANAEMRITVAQLSAELQTSLGTRDRLSAQVDRLTAAQATLESRLADLVRERAVLQGRIEDLEAARSGVDARLLEVLNERDALLGKLAEVEDTLRIATAERDALNADLESALTVIDANRDTIELQLRDLERLRRDLDALRTVRAELETEVAALIAARDALQGERDDLLDTRAVLEGDLDEARNRVTELVDRLAAERDTSRKLEARLADERERTLLAQSELEQRDIRLEELLSELKQTETALESERDVSSEAQQQIELLNLQILALRQQLARIEVALEISEQLNEDQRTQIVDLGRRLNAALATKVQELARFRSEFFGRLREVLAGREDIRIVGDRFVFQSEVLFASGSADIGEAGQRTLEQLAAALVEIAARIPSDINWILQIEGHTDTVPIFNEQFANNWELSAARAISVVEYLTAQGIPPDRLSATGYGEHQPIDPADLIRNRRIELKLTQR